MLLARVSNERLQYLFSGMRATSKPIEQGTRPAPVAQPKDISRAQESLCRQYPYCMFAHCDWRRFQGSENRLKLRAVVSAAQQDLDGVCSCSHIRCFHVMDRLCNVGTHVIELTHGPQDVANERGLALEQVVYCGWGASLLQQPKQTLVSPGFLKPFGICLQLFEVFANRIHRQTVDRHAYGTPLPRNISDTASSKRRSAPSLFACAPFAPSLSISASRVAILARAISRNSTNAADAFFNSAALLGISP